MAGLIFMAGLGLLSREEKIALIAQLEVLTPLNLAAHACGAQAHRARGLLVRGTAKLAETVSPRTARRVKSVGARLDWDPEVIGRALQKKTGTLSFLTDEQLMNRLAQAIACLLRMKGSPSLPALAYGVIYRAARSMNIDPVAFSSITALENAVFEEYVCRQLEAIKRELMAQYYADPATVEETIRAELDQLSTADRDAVAKALKLEVLSSQAVISVFKTMSITAIAQSIASSFGLGSHLFLTTSMRAAGLAATSATPFAASTAAASFLGFLVSFPAFAILTLASAGLTARTASGRLKDGFCCALVVIGRGRMMRSRESMYLA